MADSIGELERAFNEFEREMEERIKRIEEMLDIPERDFKHKIGSMVASHDFFEDVEIGSSKDLGSPVAYIDISGEFHMRHRRPIEAHDFTWSIDTDENTIKVYK